MRKLILALLLAFTALPAFAQVPPPVPALPDAERRTAYSITATTCACSVGFALYGDQTDYQDWVEVWLNGVQVSYNDPVYGWTLTSATGTLGSIPLPITNAIITFTNAQTGTVQIVGADRPRRLSQFTEGRGVAARDLNQVITSIVAVNRETWDKTNDLTGRGLFFAPGNTTGPMPLPSACANAYLGFDSTGLNPKCLAGGGGGGTISGPASSTVGHFALWNNATGTLLSDAAPNTFSTTVNGQTCALSGTCTITTAVGALTVGTTTITGGSNGNCLYIGSGLLAAQSCGTATSVAVGTTTVSAGTTGYLLYNNGGTLGNEAVSSLSIAASQITGTLALANGGTAAALTANNGGGVYSTVSALGIVNYPGSSGLCWLSGQPPTWGACAGVVNAAALTNSTLGFGFAVNAQLATSVGSNALTISLCTTNSGSNTCNAATSGNPILLPFRDPTLANGDPVIISQQAALSFTIASGSTMGCISGAACRLRIYAYDIAGTVALCAYNPVSGKNIIGVNAGTLYETQSGTSGGNTAQGLYCSTASTGTAYPVLELGYIEITETTAGTWTANAAIIQLMGPGIKKAGETVQEVNSISTSSSSITSSTFSAIGPTLAITPTSAANLIRVESNGTWGVLGSASAIVFQLTRGGSSIGQPHYFTATGAMGTDAFMLFYDAPASTSSLTYGTEAKNSGSSTTYYPNASGSVTTVLTEIMS